ncbi:hypothetical protein OCU04_003418 [Sclerotinia nivalis]|uniref:Uncharacterized protein n=1 Tax=Sclerotinia nivalis TaxID=352851 RepID=A0A9X0ARV7_9HELO|nr:hypothetical protein OCU04_003418 [Sclerotinia nivalis]
MGHRTFIPGHIEEYVTYIMVSIIPFSTLFVTVASRSLREKRKGPLSSLIYFWKQRKNSLRNGNWVEMSSGGDNLFKPPNPILSGMRMFIRRNNRDNLRDSSVIDSTALVSKSSGTLFVEPEQDYQKYLRYAADSGKPQGYLQYANQKQSAENIV